MKPLRVYNVVQGPISTYDIPDWDERHGWLTVCLVEQENGAVEEEEIIFDTFDEAYEVVSWFKGQIIPFDVVGYA
jgi:hypothetical protein